MSYVRNFCLRRGLIYSAAIKTVSVFPPLAAPRYRPLPTALGLGLALVLRFRSSLRPTYCALARRAVEWVYQRLNGSPSSTLRVAGRRPASARRASITLASPGPFSVDIHDGKMHIATSIDPRPAREFLAKHCEMTDVGRGARAARRRDGAKRRHKRSGSFTWCVNWSCSTPFPDAFSGILRALSDAELLRFDAKCAEGRAEVSSRTPRAQQREGGGMDTAAAARSAAFFASCKALRGFRRPSRCKTFAF
ncbi:uncharacterized protein SCHCODRAFT_02118744 [Schizophyllum commune H4-8]|uniref:uncharacterized protein n=1 Tax=Schizophyllum commune (strain H4-8 / FGSC 9210) TaxID=578458 RepID=UPI00215F1B62|nr:uncharacterized protein SCHCODRAFT_02118744 [Schizophyllum commune H4-8]KAI5885567.1 hypothetical protein SCHCODRAFT_02118744 [Schizophyllum commune H4-8]